MTKTEQNRVIAWRLKVLHEASAPGPWPRPDVTSLLAQRDLYSSSNPSANDTAAAASFILRDVNRVMRSPMLLLSTV
jgi:hypothetical protein